MGILTIRKHPLASTIKVEGKKGGGERGRKAHTSEAVTTSAFQSILGRIL